MLHRQKYSCWLLLSSLAMYLQGGRSSSNFPVTPACIEVPGLVRTVACVALNHWTALGMYEEQHASIWSARNDTDKISSTLSREAMASLLPVESRLYGSQNGRKPGSPWVDLELLSWASCTTLESQWQCLRHNRYFRGLT